MTLLAYLLSLSCLLLNLVLFLRLRPPLNFMLLWMPQLLQHALSPFLVLIGMLGALLGWLYNEPIAAAAGLLGAGISAVYIWRVITRHADFSQAFGTDWESKFQPHQKARMLQHRWRPGLPRTEAPRWERDIPFWTIPGTERKLLCDVWQPPDGVAPSGLGIVYLHGSGWYLSDKDFGTRPFFRQLTAQGHVVMDVAYRLCPEVDIYDMVGDVKRAVSWMKTHAGQYHVNSERIVLAGASAGGHLAMLAAYAPDHPQFTPPDLQGDDLSVRAVVSAYGPTDLGAVYERTKQTRVIGLPSVEIGLPGAADKQVNMQDAGRLDLLLGGHLHEIPEVYELASPITHIHPDCPPTLLFNAALDCVTPPTAIQEHYQKLVDCGVPATIVTYPMTQHAYDLLLPQLSPPAQAELYDMERFLALVA